MENPSFGKAFDPEDMLENHMKLMQMNSGRMAVKFAQMFLDERMLF
jgi:hypothetical protein